MVSFRHSGTLSEESCSWDSVPLDTLNQALPWRYFRWHKGQKHYSGSLWTATERDHVIYESRLEMARLLYADFDISVHRIVAQPFLLSATVAASRRTHVPDYLLVSDAGPVVVDVKPARRAIDSKNAFTFDWTQRVVERQGWRYELWTEPPPAEWNNVRYLAGYRRDWLFDQDLVDRLRTTDLDGATLAHAFTSLPEQPRPLVRSAVLHLLWRQHFLVDLSRPLTSSDVLRRAG
jgi:hypothetical protein